MTEETKEVRVHGILILEGGTKFAFESRFDCYEDAPDWMRSIDNFELPDEELIWAGETGSGLTYCIPVKKILAYHVKFD